MARPTGSLSIGFALRIGLSLSAGFVGALALYLLLMVLHLNGVEAPVWGIQVGFDFTTARLLAGTGTLWGLLYAPVLWGARVNPWMQGVVVGTIPFLVEGLIVLPVVQGAGMFGLAAGWWGMVWVIVAHVLWGTVGGWWNAWCLNQLQTDRNDQEHDGP